MTDEQNYEDADLDNVESDDANLDTDGEEHEESRDTSDGDSAEQDGQEESEELASAEDDAERERIRERRREERRQKKEYRQRKEEENRALIDSLRREKQELAERLGRLEQRDFSTQLAQVDHAIEQAKAAAGVAEGRLRRATEVADGEELVAAQRAWYEANQRAQELTRVRQQFSQLPQQQRQHIDPAVVSLGQQWMQKNNWYNPASGDPDSRIALVVDEAVRQDGYDPRTPEYWQELDNRLKKNLPHRYVSANIQRNRPKSVVSGSGKEGSAAPAKGYSISPDRVAAMKEAGVWDNPQARKEMIDYYRKYDREHGAK